MESSTLGALYYGGLLLVFMALTAALSALTIYVLRVTKGSRFGQAVAVVTRTAHGAVLTLQSEHGPELKQIFSDAKVDAAEKKRLLELARASFERAIAEQKPELVKVLGEGWLAEVVPGILEGALRLLHGSTEATVLVGTSAPVPASLVPRGPN